MAKSDVSVSKPSTKLIIFLIGKFFRVLMLQFPVSVKHMNNSDDDDCYYDDYDGNYDNIIHLFQFFLQQPRI